MSSPFVPFLKAGLPAAGNRASVKTDSAAASGAFIALGNAAAATGATPTVRPAPHCTHSPAGSPTAPTVTLQKDGDRVTHIRIECTCGQVVELECAY
jgi:hypothetical protein